MRSREAAHKQAAGDLTWEVPLELEPDFGLSLADRDRRLLAQQRQQQQLLAAASQMGDSQAPAAGGSGATAAAGAASVAGAAGDAGVAGAGGAQAVGDAAGDHAEGSHHGVADAAPAAPLPLSMIDLQRSVFTSAAAQHLNRLVMQLLRSEGVHSPDTWAPVITSLAQAAVAAVSPAALVASGQLDPRLHIKVRGGLACKLSAAWVGDGPDSSFWCSCCW